MALEIARLVPHKSRVLDVGCGNGFIAHHLSALVGTSALGIDLATTTEAAIDYRQFDATTFPVSDNSVEAVLLCYVLHHVQDLGAMMKELRRVLTPGGRAIIYEDIPETRWDRWVCWIHNLKWRKRTGPCAFRGASDWQFVFESQGFKIESEYRLSRWRNVGHPVRRKLYVLKLIC